MAKKTNKKTNVDPAKKLRELLVSCSPKETEFYPTRLPGLDRLLGGGFPTCKLIEIHGESQCGKTSVSLHLLRLLMEAYDVKTALLDVEKSVDGDFKTSLGLTRFEETVDEQGQPLFLHLRLDTFGQAFEAMKTAFANGYKFVVWDSMTTTVADAALGKDVEAEEGGLQARAQARILPLIKREAYNADGTVIILNQMRTNMSGARPGAKSWGYGSKPAGGKALEFAADVRINLQPIKALQVGKNPPYGVVLKATGTKNKLAPPYQSTTLPLHFGKGVNINEHLRDLAIDEGIFTGDNGYYTVPGEEIKIHGLDALALWVRDHAEVVLTWLSGDREELEAS